MSHAIRANLMRKIRCSLSLVNQHASFEIKNNPEILKRSGLKGL